MKELFILQFGSSKNHSKFGTYASFNEIRLVPSAFQYLLLNRPTELGYSLLAWDNLVQAQLGYLKADFLAQLEQLKQHPGDSIDSLIQTKGNLNFFLDLYMKEFGKVDFIDTVVKTELKKIKRIGVLKTEFGDLVTSTLEPELNRTASAIKTDLYFKLFGTLATGTTFSNACFKQWDEWVWL